MRRSRSDTHLATRKEVFGRRGCGDLGSAIPGYGGHVPGLRHDDATHGSTFTRAVQASIATRSRSTFCPQTMRMDKEVEERRMNKNQSAPCIRAPAVDSRGIGYPAAGDTFHSRIRAEDEEKDHTHHHSSMGLTSFSHENRGAAEKMRGYGRAARGVPGYSGYVPGKHAENVHADTWSKASERSLGAHFQARQSAPKKWGLLTDQCTVTAPMPADTVGEVPLFSPSFHDRVRGWSNCQFAGCSVDPAGRLAPRDKQESYGLLPPPAPNAATHGYRGSAIHGYAGFVPCRVGENVAGYWQCKTNMVSEHLFRKNLMRHTQR